ncbi:hypothetical protein AB8880_07670 [Alphaproteobacteria bacterium LSUCC0684]
MTPHEEHEGPLLLPQVIGFVGMLTLAFAESALGHMPIFFGSVPRIMLIMLFILTLQLPAALPTSMVVIVGLVYDLVQGSPLGYTVSLMVIVQAAVMWRRVRLADADAGTVWSEFGLVMAVVQIYGLLVLVLYTGHFPAIGPVLFQFASTVLLFPILYWLTILSSNLSLVWRRGR